MNQYLTREMVTVPGFDGDFDSVGIKLAASDAIRDWSYGEVKNPETINYRTYKPERGGLFCERIFGPTKDWECSCGKYKRIKHKGVTCDRCGVEVTLSKVRRQRMGHIELVVPVSHIWFFKCTPSRMGLMLDMTATNLERVLYYEDYLVTDPGDTPLKKKQLLTELEYREALESFGDESFEAGMGAKVVQELLAGIELDEETIILDEQLAKTKSKQTRKKLAKKMSIIEGFRVSGTRPEWMVLNVLPVIPPELRPLVPLEGGRFATSDLNDLYRRVINRNNRLKNLLSLKTPDVIIRNEKRMLQEAVDAVFDNGRHGRAVTGPGNRPLKSLSEMLKGKTGRFRQNLLGKRVDYSGRSVIVVGPKMKIHQCGLPKKMALTLFEPFIIRRLKELGITHTVRSAKKLIESKDDVVWNILEEVITGKTVMLNRAPTLHRLSIQSFEPILVEGDAIHLHPLVCTAFNADFDGDQMAVHVPLSVEAQMESRLMMLSSNSIFSPSSGQSIMTPTQDIALGVYYLTTLTQKDKMAELASDGHEENPKLPIFGDCSEVFIAYEDGALRTRSQIYFRNPDYGRKTIFGDSETKILKTTVGRVFFNEIWPEQIGFINKKVDKSLMGKMIWHTHNDAGHKRTVELLDELKALGYKFATIAGVSVGITDTIIPPEKQGIIDEGTAAVSEVEKQYKLGVITDGERHNKIQDIWTHATERIANVMISAIEENNDIDETNSVFMMFDSKARGSKLQIRQLAGMRGLMAKPSGEIIETPITSNFREGLSVLEYFSSTHGARKGLADTALKTADAGYLTRKLVDVSQDVIIVEQDCNTLNGITVAPMMQADEEKIPLEVRILGRTCAEDIRNPITNEIAVPMGTPINEAIAAKIKATGVTRVKIRSVLTCEAEYGVCAKCYGRDLATGKGVEIGTAVGIIAAQSIGEPGTQLTMRTFHIGGTASSVFKQPEVKVKTTGRAVYHDLRIVKNRDGELVVLNKNGSVSVHDEHGRELDRYVIEMGATIYVEEHGLIKEGSILAAWDPYSIPIISDQEGSIEFHEFVEGVSVKKEKDAATGRIGTVVLETRENLHPQIVIKDKEGNNSALYTIPAGAHVMVKEGESIFSGQVIAKTPRKESKTKDITGGLPRVSELFEARSPKDAAEIAKIDGIVDFGPNQRGKRCLIIRDENTKDEEEHLIAMGKHIVVFKNDRVKKGQQLTEGPVVPQEILEVCGPQELQEYLVNEVQMIYCVQGVEINDKHIEIIVRQMLRKVRITDPGDTEFLWGEQISRARFEEINKSVMEEGRRPAQASPALLGITKASLETDSFISAASFQDTTRVLTDAASLGRQDVLRGFKENVIMGHLIPGGTGFHIHKNIKLVPLVDPIYEEKEEEPLRSVEETSEF
ncbi:MAG: DNA-directed RNA polymerase subunit beta' [Kiritimatiellae bacterium]|jgi:DNA-directed RNA polymerase subunit beta'|nr:DNA-directed RNA polymerase subunit beta' [Kiritimatiellia bacterium]